MIPYRNGELTSIVQPSTAPDYDDAAVPGAARWTGSVGIYVSEKTQEVQSMTPGNVDEAVLTRLELPFEVGRRVVRGDVLVYDFEETTHQRVAETIIRSPIVGRVQVLVEAA